MFGSRTLLVRALLVRALLVVVVASSGPGGFRLTRLLRVVAGELWLDILKGVSWKGLCG